MPSVDPVALRTQVRRIVESPLFAKAKQLSRFLEFVTTEIADEIKEYRIGVEVFDRGAGFDPRIDPVVRLQASKLRSRLAEYYGT